MEQMTKERLMAYRSNKAEILELDYVLNNRWKSDTMIGNDVIFDYSKGYPMPQSVTGFDSEKYERLQIRDLKRKEKLEKECEEVEMPRLRVAMRVTSSSMSEGRSIRRWPSLPIQLSAKVEPRCGVAMYTMRVTPWGGEKMKLFWSRSSVCSS